MRTNLSRSLSMFFFFNVFSLAASSYSPLQFKVGEDVVPFVDNVLKVTNASGVVVSEVPASSRYLLRILGTQRGWLRVRDSEGAVGWIREADVRRVASRHESRNESECEPGQRYTYVEEPSRTSESNDSTLMYAVCIWSSEDSKYVWYVSNMDPDYDPDFN